MLKLLTYAIIDLCNQQKHEVEQQLLPRQIAFQKLDIKNECGLNVFCIMWWKFVSLILASRFCSYLRSNLFPQGNPRVMSNFCCCWTLALEDYFLEVIDFQFEHVVLTVYRRQSMLFYIIAVVGYSRNYYVIRITLKKNLKWILSEPIPM